MSPKLFGNLWGNSCVQFLMIISCFTFPLLWKKRPKFSTEKSPSPCWFWRNLPGTVSFSISYQQWLNRQWLFISAPYLCLVPSLIFSQTKQPCSKCQNVSVWKCYLFQSFTRNCKIRRGIISFASQRNFKQTFV